MGGTTHEKMITAFGEAEYERAWTIMQATGWAVLPDQSVLAMTGSKYYGLPLSVLHEWEQATP